MYRISMAAVWDLRAKFYDVCEASDLRRGPSRKALFSDMRGRILLLGVGTGVDIPHFPLGRTMVGIDISEKMLVKARKRARAYSGRMVLLRPGGRLLMFERVRSRNRLLGLSLDMMTLWTRWSGTEMHRDTLSNARTARFRITSVASVFLDIILAIRGAKAATTQEKIRPNAPARLDAHLIVPNGRQSA